MSKEINDTRERLAGLCHKQWSGWLKYMFGKCLKKANGTLLIPEWAVTRWLRQAYTPYNKLSSQEKDSDRKEADKFITLLKQQPPAGEFTKEAREKVTEHRIIVGNYLLEACDRLDRAEAINKDLLEALKKYGQHSQECHDERYPEAWHCICGFETAIAKAKE